MLDAEKADETTTAGPVPVQPVLDYATPGADGLPEYVPEAETLIDQGRSPRAIRRFFRNADKAVRYFARSMSRRYAPEMLGSRCVDCGEQAMRLAIQVQWLATMPPRFLELRISSKPIEARFETLHPICEWCLQQWATALARFTGPIRWAGWLGAGFFGLIVASILFPRTFAGSTFVVAIFGLIGAVLLQWVLRLFRWVQLPAKLKWLMPWHVKPIAMKSVFAREGDTLRGLTE